jgi:ubiquinone/menaquinone biosynthesis C-methylase UbiE
MSETEPWSFEDDPSALYERFLVPTKFLPWAEELVRLGDPQPGERVLDVACGTGTVTRLLPPLVGDTGTVTGLDLDPSRLAVAASLPAARGATIDWRNGDASALPFADGQFDIVFCQQGLQFFPDKLLALGEMRRVLAVGGRLALGVWRSVEDQPGGRAMADALERHVGAEAGRIRREPFSFGDASVVEGMVTAAGFSDVAVRPTRMKVRFPSAEAFTKRYIAARTPLNSMVAAASGAARAAVVAEVDTALAKYRTARGLELPTAVNLVTART